MTTIKQLEELFNKTIEENQYELFTIDDFKKELIENLDTFSINMKNLNVDETTYQQWFEMFMAWNEVGTEMEYEYHGPRKPEINRIG
jgi:hypothetical protein